MLKEIRVPDIGNYSGVSVIELLVSVGDLIEVDTSLIALETDKASLEVPSPYKGIIKSLNIKLGDKVSAGDVILTVEDAEQAATVSEPVIEKLPEKEESKAVPIEARTVVTEPLPLVPASLTTLHASPGVRRFARELGADLNQVQGTGPKNRILKIDIQKYVKAQLSKTQSHESTGANLGLAPWPQVDFARFGEISIEPLSRIKKLSGSFLHRNWVMVPHVTQFDEADVTELEKFRKEQQALLEKEGVKLTILAFIMKAVVAALRAFPNFNASLSPDGSQLIKKNYFHIGVAVDTANGLVVPVVRNVEQKGLLKLAKELAEISHRARLGQLTAEDMQGSSFSISSLGGIGGTAFTPIINVPDVAILGVSKSQIKPVYLEGEFRPRLMLPLSLSYDHRVIDGAEGARFITYLIQQLSDIRRGLL
jgi:pyruvate dehydrogenase E2 component (dihydrolipoamide acetyltransferase)